MGSPARPLGNPHLGNPHLGNRALGELLATGKVKRASGRVLRKSASPRWELGRLFGRVAEVTGGGASARLTVAVRLLRQAQQRGEVAGWIGSQNASFFPPDLAEHGIDLAALAVVRLDDTNAMFQAADHLLRSGAFGLVVVDLQDPHLHDRAIDVPMPVQVRLLNLTKAHDAALLLLLAETRGSLASLRARAQRERRTGRFHVALRVHKDKHVGRPWEHEEVFRGPVGLG